MARADLSGIKSAVQTILETANTTTGSPIDLSDSMASRVRQVLQINVERMPVQPSFFPCVTMFYEDKSITLQDVARDALSGRSRAEINLKIVGIVWVDNMNTTNFEYKDLADNECEQLMENIEQVLKSDTTLTGKCTWSKATNITYHNFSFSEDAHMRAGVMNYQISVFY